MLGGGEPYGTIFISRLWKKEKIMEQIATDEDIIF
jgi:hypothetical protein